MLRSTILFLIVTATVLAQNGGQQSLPLRRTVQGQTIRSDNTPALTLKFDPAFKHVGGDRFNLYGVADAELHLFVDADAEKNVRRFYWVQFEGYLPENDHTYNYDEPIVKIAGLEFYADAAVRPSTDKVRAGSDSEHMRTMLAEHGYKLPALYIRERMVHMTDASRRNELMIIYGEDARPLGITAANVDDEGRTKSGWDKTSADLLGRAKASMTIGR